MSWTCRRRPRRALATSRRSSLPYGLRRCALVSWPREPGTLSQLAARRRHQQGSSRQPAPCLLGSARMHSILRAVSHPTATCASQSDDALSLLGPALIALACFSWDQVRPPSSPRLRTCWLRSRTCMRRHLLAWFVVLVTCASEPGGGLPCRWNVDQQAATVSLRGGCAGACSGTVLARPSLCEQLVWSSVVEGSVPTLRRSGCAVRFIARKSANVDRPRANRVRPID